MEYEDNYKYHYCFCSHIRFSHPDKLGGRCVRCKCERFQLDNLKHIETVYQAHQNKKKYLEDEEKE